MSAYEFLFRRVLRHLDPEHAHEGTMVLLSLSGRVPGLSHLIRATIGRPPTRGVRVFGRHLRGPLGLAAGLDKDARAVLGLDALGFGHIEIGTVTAHAQPGNDKPRLWRRVDEAALVNRMGFNNRGAAVAADHLRRLRGSRRGRSIVVGANIGKSRITPVEDAAGDYAHSAALLAPWADYLAVNVSSPNTPGLRDLQAVESLEPILRAVQDAADASAGRRVPVLVKVSPDLDHRDLDAIADLVLDLELAGVIATNTTIAHDHGAGGLSGPVLTAMSREAVGRLRQRLGPTPVIIGVGGVATLDDARALLDAGATLLQAYTAFIYRGPAWPGRMNREVTRR